MQPCIVCCQKLSLCEKEILDALELNFKKKFKSPVALPHYKVKDTYLA